MSLVAKAVESMKRWDSTWLSTDPIIAPSRAVRALLQHDKLVLADVGSAGGVDPRWERLKGLVGFITFEPQDDSGGVKGESINFPICLGSEKGERLLHLTQFRDSSSLYPINSELMNDFAVAERLAMVDSTCVKVDTLDNCLAQMSDPRLDFVKLDVEGAELDVLKGADRALREQVLGLRIEVSFARRHVGAPEFGEVHTHLRENGFEMFALSRELMMRRNQLHGPLSQPQLVWGDALYFQSRVKFFERLDAIPAEQRAARLAKFVILLLAHRIHDYALEIILAARTTGHIAPELLRELELMTRRSAKVPLTYVLKATVATALAAAIYVATLPISAARRDATFYLKRRAGHLFYYFWRICARGGECNAGISDPPL